VKEYEALEEEALLINKATEEIMNEYADVFEKLAK
jgi:hypothetical protein